MIYTWAQRWGIPLEAIIELQQQLATEATVKTRTSEAAVQGDIRLLWSRQGGRLWRNNVGAAVAKDGRPIRYGLNNDSAKINKVSKSSDLIGITQITATAQDIGRTFGVFTSVEVKEPNWTYNPLSEREKAQLNWLLLVDSLGGFATFANTTENLYESITSRR